MRRSTGIVTLVFGMALLLMPLFASTALAQATIVGSPHDMSTINDGAAVALLDTTATSLCTACHFPHNGGGSTAVPLSNRTGSATTFTMYSSSTINMTIAASPNASSLFCLSCHDGTTAINSWLKGDPGAAASTNMNAVAAGRYALGANLGDDHPVSVTYSPAADPAFQPAVGGIIGAKLPLDGGTTVECKTCHDPHGAGGSLVKFLRDSPANICTLCHIK